MTGASSGVARSGKLLIQSHLVAFRLIPYRLRGAGMRGSRLRGNDGGVNLGLIWPCLASFTPSGEVGNEANCGPRLALVTDTGRGWEWPGVAKLLFRFHFLPFGSISHPPNPHPRLLPEGEGICRAGDARFPSSRERRGAFVVTTHVIMVGVGAAMAQWADVAIRTRALRETTLNAFQPLLRARQPDEIL